MATKCLLAAAALVATAARGGQAAAAGRGGLAGPLDKVVTLLKSLEESISADGKAEEKMYNKYACWCKKASEEKASSINTAQEDLKEGGLTILQLKGEIATLDAEVKQLDKQMEENQKAQEGATAIRTKANEEYLAITAETKQAMVAMEKAIAVLIRGATAKAGDALLQQSAGRAVVRQVVDVLPRTAKVTPQQMNLLSEFLGSKEGYTPQSMTVQGLLKDMYTTMASDVEDATTQEAEQNRDFEEFIASSIKAVNADTEMKKKKEAKKASKEISLAEETQLYDDTGAEKKADVSFFDSTAAACESKHEQWTLRDKARTQELEGIKKALELLTTDEARELFATAIKPGKETHMEALQVGAAPMLLQLSQQEPALSAYQALKKHATGAKSLRLASLAVSVREAKAGHFDAVLEKIDQMMQVLKDEGTADIAKRDQCKAEITKSNSTILDLEWNIKCNDAKIATLEKKMEEIDAEKEKTLAEWKELSTFMEESELQRQQEHEAFTKAKEKDEKAIALLVKVTDTFSKYYKDHSIAMGPIQGGVKDAAFVQRQPAFERSQFDAPDFEFSEKGKRKGEAKGIIGMLTMVTEDLQDEIRNAVKEEATTLLAFEDQMAASGALVKAASEKVTMLEGMHARTGEEKATEAATMAENKGLLKDEKSYLEGITPDCEWVFKAFFERDAKRTAEMEGLEQAKSFLSGAKASAPAELAQVNKFDDAALGRVRFLRMRA